MKKTLLLCLALQTVSPVLHAGKHDQAQATSWWRPALAVVLGALHMAGSGVSAQSASCAESVPGFVWCQGRSNAPCAHPFALDYRMIEYDELLDHGMLKDPRQIASGEVWVCASEAVTHELELCGKGFFASPRMRMLITSGRNFFTGEREETKELVVECRKSIWDMEIKSLQQFVADANGK